MNKDIEQSIDLNEDAIKKLQEIKQRDERAQYLNNFANTLLEQCAGANLTVSEFEQVIERLQREMKSTTFVHA